MKGQYLNKQAFKNMFYQSFLTRKLNLFNYIKKISKM